MWIRQPTPKMRREQPDKAGRVINWPTWIYEHIGIKGAGKSAVAAPEQRKAS